MRRISLAFALAGAVAAVGCGSNSSPNTGTGKGVKDGTFQIEVQNTAPLAITGGVVTSTPAGISCGSGNTACAASFPFGTTVTLVAVANASPVGNLFLGWSGDCVGGGACSLTGNSDRYLVATFGLRSDQTAHGPRAAAGAHVPEYLRGVESCTQCHGANLLGQGSAVSCASCHAWPVTSVSNLAMANDFGGHFDAAAGAWGDHTNGWGVDCLRCHTNQGFQDYVGVDGSGEYLLGAPFRPTSTLTSTTKTCVAAGTCDPAAYAFGPLKCETCHNAVTDPLGTGITTITFITNAGDALRQVTTDKATALCGQCHQARESSATITKKIADALPASDDAKMTISFLNPHYLGAAATFFGANAAGWVQYSGKIYSGANTHGVNAGSCTSCHNSHTGALPVDADIPAKCGGCHLNEAGTGPVLSLLELEETRQYGFEGDIDGDGDATESLRSEIDGVAAKVYEAMQAYAANVLAAPITYTDNYPYYMNAGGTAYKTFSPRLMRAAVNYKWYKAEAGAWAHNPRYAIEVLFDTIQDLNAGLVAASQTPVAFSGLRTFEGHFGAASVDAPAGGMAFRDWDPGPVPANCSQCHAGEKGLANYLVNQATTVTSPPVVGMECTTCHQPAAADTSFTTMRAVTTLNFPPRKVATSQVSIAANTLFPKAADAVCATCHSGREGKLSLDVKIIGMADQTAWTLGFTNPHYLGAAGVMFGADTHMLYEYGTNTYATKPAFFNSPHGSPHGQSCTGCHVPQASKHSFAIDLDAKWFVDDAGTPVSCNDCHKTEPYGDFRLAPRKANVQALADLLYVTITGYSQAAGYPICYNAAAHPYWYVDANSDGLCDATETTTALLNGAAAKATFNYKWSQAEPGAYAHNTEYMEQALIDSILDLNPSAVLPFDAFKNDGVTRIARP